ncbi:two-component system, CitB family, response regulator [Terribacillus halophilus]|uniref:Two-component system, CitB family, response regulator n=1 Tax=Terribacillus halophilus TaxID=361279 RepID=A0A1G6QTZ4_9BACI|nr:response regulator [Terribacillus halophilus]SDC95225.1 two-component system, CitB family, response regulator [Terribacillus halophilus]
MDRMNVLIVEDNVEASMIFQNYLNEMEGYRLIGVAENGEQAKSLLQALKPDLVLLDVYLPDMSGIDILWFIRQNFRRTDVILLTAANDTETVGEAMRGGVYSYLIKPVDGDRFQRVLQEYSIHKRELESGNKIGQQQVDAFFHPNIHTAEAVEQEIYPKGVDRHTLETVRQVMKEQQNSEKAEEVAVKVGVSHSTVRRYLEYMVSRKEAEIEVTYGTIGRPVRKYKYRDESSI